MGKVVIIEGLRIALQLAATDIRLQYRRSSLGPLWVTLTLFAQISVIGLLFSTFFGEGRVDYILHLGSGLILWNFLVTTINESAESLVKSGALIKQVSLPFHVHTLRVVGRNFLLLVHHLLALAPYMVLRGELNGWLAFLPVGSVLVLLNLGWLSLAVAVVSARYRDLPAVISGIVVIFFYVTPILWTVDQLGDGLLAELVLLNPFLHVISVFRDPLLGNPFPIVSAGILLATAVLGWAFSIFLMKRKSKKIAFWV